MKTNKFVFCLFLFTLSFCLLTARQLSAQDLGSDNNILFLKAGTNLSIPISTAEKNTGGLGQGIFTTVNNLTPKWGYQIGLQYLLGKNSNIKFVPEINVTASYFSLDLSTTHWEMWAPVDNVVSKDIGEIDFQALYLRAPLALRLSPGSNQGFYFGTGVVLNYQLMNQSKFVYEEQIHSSFNLTQVTRYTPPLVSQKEREVGGKKWRYEVFGSLGVEKKLKNGKPLIIDFTAFMGIGRIISYPTITKLSLELNFSYPIF